MDYTRKIVEFCDSIKFSSLPDDVVEKAKLCVLDYIANVYGSLELDAVHQVISYIQSLQINGNTTVLGCGFKTDPHNAAFINGTTAEAIESQDGVRFGGNHPGTAVIPAVLAVAENNNYDGKAIIEAIVVGYEAANRPSAAMHPWHTLSGFLPTGTCGTFGAAAAVAKLKNYSIEQTLNALGNAGYVLPLSMAEQLMGGYTVKIIQGGQAASAGLMAAGLAGQGVTGSPVVYEGTELNGGFTKITSKVEPKLERLIEDLGKKYSIMDVYFKPYTACRHTHGAAQATLELTKGNSFSLKNIKEINVHTYGIAELAVGKGVTSTSTFVSAQFSIPYVVAVCLTDGELGPGQLTEKRMTDAKLIELSSKVKVHRDEDLEAVYPAKTSSRVVITLTDGSTMVKQVDIPKGDPRDPMEAGDISAKLHQFAGSREPQNLDEIIQQVLDLENIKDIKKLLEKI